MKTIGYLISTPGLLTIVGGFLYVKGPAIMPLEILAGFASVGLGFGLIWLGSRPIFKGIISTSEPKNGTSSR